MKEKNRKAIRVRSNHDCYLCGNKGHFLYKGLRDSLYEAPEKWNLKKCSNPCCRLLWIDPIPIEEDIEKAYETYFTHQNLKGNSELSLYRFFRTIQKNYISAQYGYSIIEVNFLLKFLSVLIYFHPGLKSDCDHSVMYLPAETNGRLLDVGCGNGSIIRHMQDLGWETEGVDFDHAAVENARKRGLKVHRGYLKNQLFPEDHFHAIVMSHLIEHVLDPIEILEECRRILKPDGTLVIVTPNNESWLHRLYKESCFLLDVPRHLHIFNSKSSFILGKKAKFSKIKVITSIHGAYGNSIYSKFIKIYNSAMIDRPLNSLNRLRGRFMQLLEWGVLQIRPEYGEEIIMIMKK